jgi:PKD repeat protein
MRKITLLVLGLTLLIPGIYAQKHAAVKSNVSITNPEGKRCSTTEAMNIIRAKDPVAFDALKIQNEQKLQNWITNHYDVSAKKAVIIIPIVVQVWENTSTVPDSRITEQIDRLNQDFGRTNSDAGNTPSTFSAVDCEIQFCLANKDPQGSVTTGIVRKTVNGSPAQSGGTDLWDPSMYLNLFVYDIGGGTLGFTYTPSSTIGQAVHIGTDYFGNTGGIYGLGRTASHEVGHWLNLEHIWGDANCGDDLVSDTPTQQSNNGGCPNHPSATCNNSGDMFMNYMDYVNDNCMNAFTAGQKTRMIGAINTYRPGLLNSALTNCSAAALNADFTTNATTINVGQTITFTDASVPVASVNSWVWNFDVTNLGGVTFSTPNIQGPHVVTYNNAGTYTVSLQVGDGSSNDTETKTSYIIVNPTGTVGCDSTAADWDWNTEQYSAATWGVDCNGTSSSGYMMGANCYDDYQWASKVSFSLLDKELTDVLYTFVQSTGTGVTNLKVWNADGAGQNDAGTAVTSAPGTILSSTTTTSGAFSANLDQLVSVPVSPAVALTGDFYIGYDHPANPAAGDTLAMGTVTGTSGNRIWANEGAAIGWRDVEYWGSGAGTSGTALNLKGTVVAVVCDISTGEKEILGTLSQTSIYPNPSVGTLNVALTTKELSTVSVYNMLGEVVFSFTKNTQLFTVDMNNQPNGVYFVKVKNSNHITTKKVVLSK